MIVYPWTLTSNFCTLENPGFAVGFDTPPPFTHEQKKLEFHTKPLRVGSLIGCHVGFCVGVRTEQLKKLGNNNTT